MLRITSPSHPLIYAFLLQEESLNTLKNVIVETENDAVKLQAHLIHLAEKTKNVWGKKPLIIKTHNDLLRIKHYDDFFGIFTTESILNLPKKNDTNFMPLVIKKWQTMSEKNVIEWITENGYTSAITQEKNTYFRQGDTISISVAQGNLQISFFWNSIENIYLDHEPIDLYTIIGV